MRTFSPPNLGVTLAIKRQPATTGIFDDAHSQANTGCFHRLTPCPLEKQAHSSSQKVFGNIYIDKMWAVCLLEADYNWLNKFVFAKQMMDKAFEGDVIPAEQFAKRGSQATEGVLTSGLFCNIG
jgi:hypothetical protein